MKRSSSAVAVRQHAGSLRVLLLGAVLTMALLAAAQPARAAFGFQAFSNNVHQASGVEEDQAGAHPYESTVSMSFNSVPDPLFGNPVPDENVKNLSVDLPAGFVGDPTAAATCTPLQITPSTPSCPVDSQVGVVVVTFALGLTPLSTEAFPVFNMAPAKGEVAHFAFNPQLGTPINIVAGVRSDSDYGITASLLDISEGGPFTFTKLTLWGVPADPSHDAQRGDDYVCHDDPDVDSSTCVGGGRSSTLTPKAFLTNPTSCGSALQSSVSGVSWQHPAAVPASASSTSASGIVGCDKLRFNPSISVTPDSTQADAPTGLTVDLTIPQNDNPNGLATPTLRAAEVSLPAGLSLNAPQADGLKGCTDDEVGLHSTAPVTCPDASKIGDVDITTPLLAEHLTGGIYLGQPVPGKTFRIFLVAGSEERGISIRLEGVLHLDPQTGLVDTTFDNNPQLPFSNLHLHFNGGPRAPLATPQTCGVKTAIAKLTPWADPNAAPVTVTSSFTISQDGHGAPCPATPGFTPGFTAGLTRAVGGADGSFTMTLTRKDQDQELGSVGVTLPKGVLARIADVKTLCSDAAAAAGTCGEDSRVGSVESGAGAGALPFFLPGRVYLTGPYKGGPFGLSIVVPAVAGPFDLGTVVVRAAIQVDRNTTQIKVVSDPLPTIVDGVPLRLRVINVNVDRPHFTFAPTNCTASKVLGRIVSTLGAVANVSSRFQVANCARLPFHPQMTFAAGGKGHTGHGASTALTTVVTMPKGDANLGGVGVSLPSTLNARLEIINKACTQAQFDAGKCAAKAGTATAVTPLLKHALRGGVYFVKIPGARAGALPKLVVALRGQVNVDLTGKVRIPGGIRLATDFSAVPDVPITKFTLHLVAGKNGPIGVADNLCLTKSKRQGVSLTFRAQNGQVIHTTRSLKVAGCHAKKGKAKK